MLFTERLRDLQIFQIIFSDVFGTVRVSFHANVAEALLVVFSISPLDGLFFFLAR